MSSPVPEFEERTLMQHLLGQLPEADQERLDALAVTEDTVAARLRDAENDLVDAYVRGDLEGEDLERFKSHYLTSTRRRRKVLFAESLMKLERDQGNVTPLPIPAPRPRSAIRWLPWAAAIALTVAAATALLDDLRMRQRLLGTNAQIEALSSRLDRRDGDLNAAETNTRSLKAQVQRLENAVADLKDAAANTRPVLVRVASFLLAAPMRSIEAPPLLNVGSDVEQISVRLSLDDAEFPQYRVTLMARGKNTPLWQSPNLAPLKGKQGPALNIVLPAERMKSGSYRFDVAGIGQGHIEPAGSYPFNVNYED